MTQHTDPAATYQEKLAAARALVADLKSGRHAPRPPIHTLDQLLAAASETHGISHRLGDAVREAEPDQQWRERCVDPDPDRVDEFDARVLVALAGCRPYHHLRHNGPQPAWAMLALHRIECSRCCQTRRNPPPGEDDRCDWCGATGVDQFTALALQRGPVLMVGDACAGCAGALLEVAA